MAKQKNIFILLLIYKETRLQDSLNYLESFFSTHFPKTKPVLLIIDNATSHHTSIKKCQGQFFETYKTSGDNTQYEFSGWESGFKKLKKKFTPQKSDLILFVNDSFYHAYGDEYLRLFKTEMFDHSQISNSILGWRDCYPEEVVINKLKGDSWIRTSFFFMTFETVLKVFPFIVPIERDKVFSNDPSRFFNDSAILSENFKGFLQKWLFNKPLPGSHYQFTWHRAEPLTSSNREDFIVKTMSILTELNLTFKADSLGIKIKPINPKFRY